jgi:hypothetical protein
MAPITAREPNRATLSRRALGAEAERMLTIFSPLA